MSNSDLIFGSSLLAIMIMMAIHFTVVPHPVGLAPLSWLVVVLQAGSLTREWLASRSSESHD